MKKRAVSIVLVLVLALSLCLPVSAAEVRTVSTDITYREISIIINGVEIAPCDENGDPTEPFIMNNTTYLPVRAIANALGLGVEWVASTSTIALTSGGDVNYGSGEIAATKATKTVDITYRGTKISLDGAAVPLVNASGDTVEPFILDGTNYLPLRIVGEALGLTVNWDGTTSTVTLSTPEPKVWLPTIVTTTASVDGQYAKTESHYNYNALGLPTEIKSYSQGQLISHILSSYTEEGLNLLTVDNVTGERWEYSYGIDQSGEEPSYYILTAYTGYGSYENLAEYYDGQGRLFYTMYDAPGVMYDMYSYYDESGRLVKEEYGAYHRPADTVVYEYDTAGKLISSVAEKDGEVLSSASYSYDAEGLVTKVLTTTSAGVETTLYSYDANGMPVKIQSVMGSDYVVVEMQYEEFEVKIAQ